MIASIVKTYEIYKEMLLNFIFFRFYVVLMLIRQRFRKMCDFSLILDTFLLSGGHPMVPRGLLGAHLTIFDNLMENHRISKM